MIFGTEVSLAACNNELWHEFYKNYVSDSMMENATYTYQYENAEKNYCSKTNDTTRLYFFIIVKKNVIGQIYLKHMDKGKKTTDFGIALINDSVKGKGYGTEAIKLLIDYVFTTLGFDKIIADTVLRNTRSQHVLEKLGFAFMYEDSNFRYYKIEHKETIMLNCKSQLSQSNIEYRKADKSDIETVTELLCELYHAEHDELTAENKKLFADGKQVFFLAFAGDKPVGVAHCALRSEYVNGTESGGTIGYLEGIYVKPEYRLNGIAASLVTKCGDWAKSNGCREFASDCLLDNTESYKFHLALGFIETERCIFFRKELS